MPQRVATGAQLAFHLRATGAGAESRQQALFVEVDQAAHPRQRNRHHRPRRVWRVDVPGHRRAAAVGNQAQVLRLGERQQLADVFGGLRECHGVGVIAQRAFAQRQPVRQALPASMQQTVMGIDAVQRVFRQPRDRHTRQRRFQRRVGQRSALP